MSFANNGDDVTTRDVTLPQLRDEAATPSSGVVDVLDIESVSNSPDSLHNPSPAAEKPDAFPLGGDFGTEPFLTSLESVTSLGQDFAPFDGVFPYNPPQNCGVTAYQEQDSVTSLQHSTPNLLSHLTGEDVYGHEPHSVDGLQYSEISDNAVAPLWRPIASVESTQSQFHCFQNQTNDWQSLQSKELSRVASTSELDDSGRSNEIIDLTESVTSLDDVSSSSDSFQHASYPVDTEGTSNDGGFYQQPQHDSNSKLFYHEPYPVDCYATDPELPVGHGPPVANYPHVTSQHSCIVRQNFFPPQSDAFAQNGVGNVFEQAVAQQNTRWSPPPVALMSSDEHNRDFSAAEVDLNTNTSHPTTSVYEEVPVNNFQTTKHRPTIELSNRELWLKFFELGTEMIITKAGRRMFPSVKLTICDLDPNKSYALAIEIQSVDNNRYRYVYHSSQWMAAGTTEPPTTPRTYFHPDSPARGELWMRQPISFDKLKLTNYEMNRKGHIILHSMHKYQPRVHLIECNTDRQSELESLLPLISGTDDVMRDDVTTVTFPECAFTTVTAYQNQQITKLKIDRNPFAKGFRDSNKQWKPKPTVEKPKPVWQRQNDISHRPVTTTIDLASEQYQHHILNHESQRQYQQHHHQSAANSQFPQLSQHYNNAPQHHCNGSSVIRSLLEKGAPHAIVSASPNANSIPFTNAESRAPINRDGEFTTEAVKRDASRTAEDPLNITAFELPEAGGCPSREKQERRPSANGNCFYFAHADTAFQSGVTTLLGSAPTQLRQAGSGCASFQAPFSDP